MATRILGQAETCWLNSMNLSSRQKAIVEYVISREETQELFTLWKRPLNVIFIPIAIVLLLANIIMQHEGTGNCLIFILGCSYLLMIVKFGCDLDNMKEIISPLSCPHKRIFNRKAMKNWLAQGKDHFVQLTIGLIIALVINGHMITAILITLCLINISDKRKQMRKLTQEGLDRLGS